MSGQLTILQQSLKHLDIPFPAAVLAAVDQAAKADAAAANIAPPPHGVLGAKVAAVLLAGDDPAADKEVQRLSTLVDIAPMAAANVKAWGQARIVDALAEAADDLLETFRLASVTAGEALSEAFVLVGDTELNDAPAFLHRGPEGATAWANANAAVGHLNNLTQAWTALADLAGFASHGGRPVLLLADLDANQFDQVGRTATAWTLARSGITIELATRATLPERIAHIAADMAERQVEADGALAVEFRRTHGTRPADRTVTSR